MKLVNDIDENLNNSTILKYADDIKLYQEITHTNSQQCQANLQEDINAVVKWINDWGLTLAAGKCRVVHFGPRNPKHSYSVSSSSPLQESSGERDLGILISNDLNWRGHISKVVRKAEGVLASLSRSFVSRSPAIFLQLYKAFVRPHLEYASSVWSPYLIRDIERLERVQRRVTRKVSTVRHCSYSERLKRLQLSSLKSRRVTADLLQMFKMACKLSSCEFDHFFTRSEPRTRGHALKVKSQFSAHDFRKHFFSVRTINAWNCLPPHSIKCTNVKAFKIAISRYCFN